MQGVNWFLPHLLHRAKQIGRAYDQESTVTRRTMFDKIWAQHQVADLGEGWALLHIDRHLLHDLSGGRALEVLAERGLSTRNPELAFATPDHAVSSLPGRTAATYQPGAVLHAGLRARARENNIAFFDLGQDGQGIVHVMAPELGIVLPGTTLICGDSHTCTNGALGALAFGVGSSELTHALATQTLRQRRPRTMILRFEGQPGPHVGPKDLILHAIGALGAKSGTGYAVEYAGSAVRSMTIEQRLTLCNLSIEMGAKIGMIAPDDKTYEYLAGRRYAPKAAMFERAVAAWRTLPSDADAPFDRDVTIDAATIAPTVTWGTSPEHAMPVDGIIPDPADGADEAVRTARRAALDYMGLEPGRPIAGTKVDWVFIGSCTNSRLVRPAAGRRDRARRPGRAGGGRLGRARIRTGQARGRGRGARPVVPRRRVRLARAGLFDVRRRQRRAGPARRPRHLDVEQELRRPAGTRRPHPSRQPRDGRSRGLARRHHRCEDRLMPGPDRFTVVAGVAAPLLRANIDTDTVIRIERLTNAKPEDTAPWLFESLRFDADGRENPDFVLNQPQFRDAPILLAGDNFGCGSSREGAVWALKYSGIRCVIAPSFGDIFANNCFQNFVLPIVLPEDQVKRLADESAGGNARVTVDLERQVVISPHGEAMPFAIEAIRRTAMLAGLDEIGQTLAMDAAIASFQADDRIARPWVWDLTGAPTGA